MTLHGPRIGIDLGGTKIAGIVLDPGDRTVGEMRADTPRENYRATLTAVAGMVEALKKNHGAVGARIGLGIPGSIGPKSGRVQNANSTWLNGQPLADDLAELLEDPLRIENDANCFALSEAADGAAADARSVFGVILGTGCGGGFVASGHLVNGPRANCGEWGHVPLPWPRADELPGPRCWCGLEGCMECWVSGPALERDYAKAAKSLLPAHEIAARAATEPLARAALGRHADRLARGLAVVVNILDPEVIVLGGGLSNMAHLYADLPGLMAPYIFADDRRVDIRRPVHGAESGARGAARLWDEP